MSASIDTNAYKGNQAVVANTTFVIIAAVFVAARLVVRLGIVRGADADDWVILASLLFSFTYAIFIWAQAKHGLGRYLVTISYKEYVALLKCFWASIPMYNLSLVLTKISIILLYLRVFVGKPMRRACWIMMAIVVTYGVWNVLAAILSCYPIPYYWDKSIEGGNCQDKTALWFSISALRIATDLAIFALPMPVLASLQLPRKQKICLMLVFAVGGCVCLMSFLRLRHIYVLAISKDIPWDNVAAATWSGIEINVGIICACLPTLKHLITYFAPCLLSSTHSHSVSSRTPSNGRIDRLSANQSERTKTPDGLSPRTVEVALVAELDNNQGISGGRKGMSDFEPEVLSMSTSTSGKDSARKVVG